MIEFKHVSKVYDSDVRAVDDLNLTVESGEFIAFIGTSGSGKTTSMRMINRMTEPTEGQILIDGKDVMDQDPVKLRRSIGYVIQNTGLMPHLTIEENIVLVPKLLGWDEEKRKEKAKEMIKLAELDESYLTRYPSELSGGQQQRIGVVRALAADQDIILMDEPLGALDPITRDALQDIIKKLQEEYGKTIVFVTHDMDEALHLASRIVIMDDGKVVQIGTPDEILTDPANDFVRAFIGEGRLIKAQRDTTTVGEVMNERFVKVSENSELSPALSLMREHQVDTLLVVDDNDVLKGFIDIQDIQNGWYTAMTVSDIVDTNLFTLQKKDLVRDSVDLILKRGYSYVPIVDKNHRIIGIVTRSTFVNVVYDALWGKEENDTASETSEMSPEKAADPIEGHGEFVAPEAQTEKEAIADDELS